ncbi:hypothetical protein SVIOM342S_00228 [Streptomyces violaceorubidus]
MVGTLGIVEFDEVDESNLQRQVIHSQADIGRSKAESARDTIKGINPYVDVVLHQERLMETPNNVMDIFEPVRTTGSRMNADRPRSPWTGSARDRSSRRPGRTSPAVP